MSTFTLHCQDGDIVCANKNTLTNHFQLIVDYLDDNPGIIEISLETRCHLIHQLLNITQHYPSTDKEWLALFDAAQYLQAKDQLCQQIHTAFCAYFTHTYRKGIMVGRYHHFDEYRKKLADHDYLTPEEIAHIRMLGRIFGH